MQCSTASDALCSRCRGRAELDILLGLLPAQKNLFAGEDGREINQPPVQVLDLYLTPVKLQEAVLDGGEDADPSVDEVSAEVAARACEGAQVLFGFVELGAELDQL